MRPISNSQLSAFRRSPAHWKQYIEQKKEQTPAMVLGSLCHCMALRKDDVSKEFFMLDKSQMPEPTKDYRTTVNAVWRDKQIELSGDRMVLESEDWNRASKAVEALMNDSVATQYLKGEYEKDLKWSSLGLEFYGIRDIFSNDYIVDLKFVQNADPRVFQRVLFNEQIYRQGGMYLDGEMNGHYTGEPHKRVLFIAIETDEPFGVSVHELDAEVINFGVNEYRMLAGQLKDCIDNNYFPSYSFRNINGSFDVYLPTYIANE